MPKNKNHQMSSDQRRRWRKRLMREDGPYCRLCNEPGYTDVESRDDPLYLTLGHIKAAVDGGRASYRNFQLEHRACNEKRGPLSLVEVRNAT